MPYKQRKALRVTFFGDSICVGQGVSIHAGWVTRLAQQLDQFALTTNRELIVTNASSNGSTTRQELERMPYEVQSQGVDILIVQFGLNDCNFWKTDGGIPRVSPDSFAANLREIVVRGQTFGARHVFLNSNHPTIRDKETFPNTTMTYEKSNRTYNQIIRNVAIEFNRSLTLNDVELIFDEVTNSDREELKLLLLDDGLHLSRKGHDLYFDIVAEKIRCCVRNLLCLDDLRSHEPEVDGLLSK